MRKFIGTVITARLQKLLIICLSFLPFLTVSYSAHAQCVNVGGIVSCALNDDDGFFSSIDITDLTINSGVTVADTGNGGNGALGGVNNGIIEIFDLGATTPNITNTFINNGSIIDTGATTNGVFVEGSILGGFINNGTITAQQEGLFVFGSINNTTNNGTINSGFNGITTFDTITNLTNNGTITSGFNGINAFGNITNLTNNGTISSDFNGITTLNTITNLTNNGTITSGFNGIQANQEINNLTNNGTISSVFNGLQSLQDITNLSNNGTISGGFDGIRANNNLNNLSNSGTIIGSDNGVSAGNILSLINSGKITGGNFAILEFNTGDTLLTLLPGSDIFGAINLSGGTNTLVVGNGLSIDHVFATLPDVINTNGAPFAVDGTRVVVVDTLQLAQQDELLFDLSQGIWGTVFNNIGDGRNPVAGFANGPAPQFSLGAVPPSENSVSNINTHMWASIFGNRRLQNDNTPTASARHDLFGFIGGLDGRVNSQWRLGGFLGFSETDIDTVRGQQDTEVESFFGGLYASLKTNSMTIDLGVTGGSTEHDSTRQVDNNQVNGLQTVSSNFDGTFIAPELSLSSQIDLGATGILQPTLRLGYAGLYLDSYKETGSTAPLSVDARDLYILHARFELALLTHSKGADSLAFHFSPYVGVEGRSLVDGEAINATLLGQNLSFNSSGSDDVASAFAGMRLSVLKTDNFGLFAGIEGSVDTEQSSTISGNLGFKWQF